MEKARHISIVGGGIIGLFCAYYLQKAGFEVAVFDKGDLSEGCSHGNAGMVVPSHFVPLAAPGMIAKGIRWMFNPESPFYIRPRLSASLLSWGWQFYRAANQKHVHRAAPALRDISLLSKRLYQELARDFAFAFEERGILLMYKTEALAEEEAEVAEMAKELGIETQILHAAEVQAMEPDIQVDILGAVYYPGDAHLSPALLLEALKKHLRQVGVTLHSKTQIQDIKYRNQRIHQLQTNRGNFSVDHLLLAGGAWSEQMARQLHFRLPMQAGKGYSVSLDQPPICPRYPSLLMEAKVAVTPMGQQLRFAGTMEIAGLDETINMRRVKGILKSIPHYLPDFTIDLPPKEKVWQGLRPCSPDGLPYIGQVSKFQNLTIASGHAMMGLSLAPATGYLISQQLSKQSTDIDMQAFQPDRYP
ncbi:MAG: FAD-dependent oxidoreductase [Bacteroidota bacterium]